MSGASRRGFLAAAGGAGAAALALGGASAPAQAAGGVGAPALAARAAGEIPLLSTYAAGAGRYGGAGAFARLRPGDALALRREPENDYDARAVSIWSARGDKLGYVPRVENQALASLMDAGLRATARVEGVARRGSRPELRLGVHLALAP